MAATVQVHVFLNAFPGTSSDITARELRHKRADDNTADLLAPIPVMSAATAYGWRRHTKIYVVSGIGSGHIGNIRWFADPAPRDWVSSAKLYACATATYVRGTAADESTNIPDSLTTNDPDADTITRQSPMTVNGSPTAITANASYGAQDFVVQQVGILSTATSGVKTGRRCIYLYDEVT